MHNKNQRQAHAVTNLASRLPKARKIEMLLDLQPNSQETPLHILEIGCGAGGIAHYFATAAQLNCCVKAVDVHDNRQVFDNYEFTKVEGVALPYENNIFDVVISNHVIEHVGMKNDQIQHLQEIKRVLKPGGKAYLAVPNRWMLTEPHYQLKFLSWWPHSWRSPYLRMMGKGDFYDCEPLEMAELENMLKIAGVGFENISVPATRITFALEKPDGVVHKILKKVPDGFLNPLRGWIPTIIYKISKE